MTTGRRPCPGGWSGARSAARRCTSKTSPWVVRRVESPWTFHLLGSPEAAGGGRSPGGGSDGLGRLAAKRRGGTGRCQRRGRLHAAQMTGML